MKPPGLSGKAGGGYLADISAARIAVFGDHRPADALIGVATLAEPGYLIEVDAIAVVD